MQKEVSYLATNTYDTLNELTEETENVWMVFHGIGYLSRYFIRLFQELDTAKNYIIAPQAPSKYYKNEDYRRVGASWLTKENTLIETQNVLRYIDEIFALEDIPKQKRLIIVGYSQGVSIATRWLSSRKIQCQNLILISGGFPKELNKEKFDYMNSSTKIHHILGKNDPYFEIEKVNQEKERVQQILPSIQFLEHQGGHELNLESIKQVLNI